MAVLAPALKQDQRSRLAVYDTLFRRLWLVGAVLLLAVFPLSATNYQLTIGSGIALAVVGAVATNLLIGVAGQASIGNAAFMAIGGFSATFFGIDLSLPFPVVVILSGAVGAVIGVLVGIPAFRLRGMYLVIATLALHFVVLFAVDRYQTDKVGPGGFLLPRLSIGNLTNQQLWYYILTLSAVVSIVVMTNLLRSRFGRAWAALGHQEIAAEVLGVNVRAQKLLVFALTSFMIAAQGALFVYYLGVATREAFTFDLAVQYIAIIVIGGSASVLGSVLGAAFVVGLPHVVVEIFQILPEDTAQELTGRLFDIQTMLYGAAIILFLIIEPGGLVQIWRRIRSYLGPWPMTRASALREW